MNVPLRWEKGKLDGVLLRASTGPTSVRARLPIDRRRRNVPHRTGFIVGARVAPHQSPFDRSRVEPRVASVGARLAPLRCPDGQKAGFLIGIDSQPGPSVTMTRCHFFLGEARAFERSDDDAIRAQTFADRAVVVEDQPLAFHDERRVQPEFAIIVGQQFAWSIVKYRGSHPRKSPNA